MAIWVQGGFGDGCGVKNLRAFAFDAYGTLFDVFSVTSLCEQLFPGRGEALAQLWRAKQLQYSLLTSMMHRYKDFWELTSDGLVYAANALKLTLTHETLRSLMDAYLRLAAFPELYGQDSTRSRHVGCRSRSCRTAHLKCCRRR